MNCNGYETFMKAPLSGNKCLCFLNKLDDLDWSNLYEVNLTVCQTDLLKNHTNFKHPFLKLRLQF